MVFQSRVPRVFRAKVDFVSVLATMSPNLPRGIRALNTDAPQDLRFRLLFAALIKA